jgi:hypothetical protein
MKRSISHWILAGARASGEVVYYGGASMAPIASWLVGRERAKHFRSLAVARVIAKSAGEVLGLEFIAVPIYQLEEVV